LTRGTPRGLFGSNAKRMERSMISTRRSVLAAMLTSPALALTEINLTAAETTLGLDLTPDCHDGEDHTVAQTEGPYFKPSAPLRRDLAVDAPRGERMTIGGLVLDPACRPVPKARVQIWHADASGAYDNKGYRLRGYQYADDDGRWWFSTIVPAAYPGRTRHYHVKVQKPRGRILTTQLYFPGERLNDQDSLFDRRLVMRVSSSDDGRFGRFDFVV
jgi:protocatechuate 3,4-dioxygenase beta subunit